MWWLEDIVIPAILILGIYCFVRLARFQTQRLGRKSTRTAEDLYPGYADSIPKQRRYAREHGGQWRDGEGPQQTPASGPAPRSTTDHPPQ